MAADMAALTGDLAAESADLFAVVSGLAEPDWRRETPSAGWTIRDQVAHLAYFDEVATRSAVDPDGFRREAAELAATGDDVAEQVVGRSRDRSGANVLAWPPTPRPPRPHQGSCAAASSRPSTRPWFSRQPRPGTSKPRRWS